MEDLIFYRFTLFLYRFKAFVNFLTKLGITGSEVAVVSSEFRLS
jgi:hypothetical protein